MVFPADAQEKFCNKVSRAMGFDFEAGRMDRSTHPFCAGYGQMTLGLLQGSMKKTRSLVCMQ